RRGVDPTSTRMKVRTLGPDGGAMASHFFFSSRRRHTRSVSAFLLNRSSDLRNATSLNSRFKSLDTLKVKIISVTFRRVIRSNHKKASKIWRHENIQLGGCQS